MVLPQLLFTPAVGYGVALYLLIAFVINRILLYNRLKHINGPWLASWSRLWLFRSTYRATLYSDLANVCKQHGTPYHSLRTGPCYE